MNRKYIYPQNLKSAGKLWLWSLKNLCIIGVCGLLSILLLAKLRTVFPLGIIAGYAFLTIQLEDRTVLDFLRNATKFFIKSQQHYIWKEGIS